MRPVIVPHLQIHTVGDRAASHRSYRSSQIVYCVVTTALAVPRSELINLPRVFVVPLLVKYVFVSYQHVT
ncbi:hypothetical protein D3C77_617650 [compost metagenome]